MGDLVPQDDLPEATPPAPSRLVPVDDLPADVAPSDPGPPTTDSLRAAFQAVQDISPDEQGRVRRLSRATGIPRDIVAADPGAIERGIVPRQLELLPSHSPAVAAHVQDPANMAAAKDDLDRLSTIEWWLTGGLVAGAHWDDEPLRYQPPVWWEALRKGTAGVRESLRSTARQHLTLQERGLLFGAGPTGGEPRVSIFTPPEEVERLLREARKVRPEEIEARQTALDQLAAAREIQARGIISRAWIGTFQAVPFVAPVLAATATGGPTAGFVVGGGLGAATTYGPARERLGALEGPGGEKLSEAGKTALAAPVAVGAAAIYGFGLGRFTGAVAGPIAKRLPGEIVRRVAASATIPTAVAKMVARFGIAEAEGAATMAAATALEEAGVEFARTKVDPGHDFDTTPIVDRALETFEAGLVDFALLSAFGAGRRFVHDVGVSRASAREARALEEAAKAVQESKLAERDPNAIEEIVGQANPGATVLVKRDAWNGYWQGKRTDPRAKAAEIVGDEGHAYDTGSDFLALPLKGYLARLGRTEAVLALHPDSKMSAESRTPREELDFQTAQVEQDKEVRKARAVELERDKGEVARVVREQAVEAGIDREQAAAVGELVASSAETVAVRTGLDMKTATVVMGTGRFRFLGTKGADIAQAAHERLKADLAPAQRENLEALERGDRRAQMRLAAEAYNEPGMPGLRNKAVFAAYQQTKRPGTWDVAIDVQNLSIQDVIGGHVVGDVMLKNISAAMAEAREATGIQGTLYRRGGDEFHVGGVESEAAAQRFAKAFVERLKAKPEVAPGYKVSASIGIGPDIQTADRASFVAKERKVKESGTYAKGQEITPEALAKLGAAESHVEVMRESVIPKGETPIAQIEGKTATVKVEQPAKAVTEQAGPSGPRAVIRMQIDSLGRPVDFPVEMLNGDASTAFHELGHFLSWAMHDVAADPRGKPFAQDYAALLKWAGYATPEERLHANLERSTLAEKTRTPAEENRLRALKAKEERIGHGFEQYLAEGVAPSKPLARVFGKLREWMLNVYEGLFGIGEVYRTAYGEDIQLTNEIRGVFDRWLSAERAVQRSEAEAGAAEAKAALLPMLDEKDRERLTRADDAAREEAEREVYVKVTQAEEGPLEKLRDRIREQIAAEVDAEPVRQLATYLARGKAPEAGIVDVALGNLDVSLLDEHGRPFRLDRKTLVEDYGADVVKQLPRGATVTEGGVSADALAQRFGFPDGDAMIEGLKTMGDRDAVVEARLQDRMRELFPAVTENPAAMVRAAVEAEHTPKAAEAALEGARILVRQVDPSLALRLRVMEDHAIRRASAEGLISGTRIAAAQPEVYLIAERRHAREALELTAKALGKNEAKAKEYAAQAMTARDLQLLNMELYRVARDAQREAQKGAEYLASMTRDKGRRELGKATSAETDADGKVWVTQPYLDRMDDLLGSIDFRKGGAARERAARFQEWLDRQPADSRDDLLSRVSQKLINGLDKTRHWRDLTVQEMRDLVAAAETIEAQAKLKSRLRTKQGEREKEAVVNEIVADLTKRFPRGGGLVRFPAAESLLTRLREAGKTAKATVVPPEELYRELGPALKGAVWDGLSDAELEARRLVREIGEPIIQSIQHLSRRERKFMRSTVIVNGTRVTGEQILAAALNWGNLSNRDKMQRGEQTLGERYRLAPPISSETFKKAMALLTPVQVKLVNTIHERVGKVKWEDIAALEKEFTGLAPPKIEAAPWTMTLADGTEARFEGGYYPVAYDPRLSTAGERAGEQVREGVGALAFAANYERATTPQGHLQRRIETFARPIDLTLSALPRAVVNHMRDLAMRRTLVQTREILTDPRVRDAIQEAVGDQAYRVLTDHWRDTANEYAAPRSQADWLVRWGNRRRTAVTGAVLAGNVGLAVQNFANVVPALQHVPAGLLAKAFGRFSVERMEMVDRISELSPTMRERRLGWQTSIARAAMGLVGKQGRLAEGAEAVREAGLWMMETTDMVTAFPVWQAAYDHAMRPKGEGARGMPEAGSRATGLGMTHEQAIRRADEVVRLSQASYRWMDRSAFERHQVFRHFSIFYRYMNSQLGQFLAAHADRRLLADEGFKREAMRRIVKGYAYLMASGVVADLLVGKGPEDYDQDGEITASDWAHWTAVRAVLYPPSTAPAAGGFLQQLVSQGGPVRDPSLLPATRPITAAVKAALATEKAMSEVGTTGDARKAALQALEAFGWYYGLPVVQFRRTGDYWFDITPDGIEQSLESQEDSPAEQFFKSAYGGDRAGRLSEALFGE